LNLLIRGIRLIDPLAGLDVAGRDVRFEEGRITAVGEGLVAGSLAEVDLTPPAGVEPCVLAPGFIDLHAHLREPGDEAAETLASGAAAAAAGGFTTVVAMANTRPPVDTPERVAAAVARAAGLPVRILPVAALTRGLAGDELVDIPGCYRAGAVAFSDDGRNAAPPSLLTAGLRAAAGCDDRSVLIHAEDEAFIASASPPIREHGVRIAYRPAEAESRAVNTALEALAASGGTGRLHLQHLSTAAAVELVRQARYRGQAVTAEVTPHHLTMSRADPPPEPPSLARVNPPLREPADSAALLEALRDGVIDAVATDHAPHTAAAKGIDQASAPPGMIGLETALAICLGAAKPLHDWIAVLVARLTAGPHRVLGPLASLPAPRLRIGEAATCVLFDPGQVWTVGGAETIHSRSSNTPWWGRQLRGQVLLTIVDGRVAHRDTTRLNILGGSVHV